MDNQPFNPLHGVTLKTLVTELVEYFGYPELGQQIKIKWRARYIIACECVGTAQIASIKFWNADVLQ